MISGPGDGGHNGDSLKFHEDGSGGKVLRYRPVSSEAPSSQQVSERELASYMSSIPEFGGKSVSELADSRGGGSGSGFYGIPTIHIPKFDNIQSNNNPDNKVHGCQYCKKSFVSPAKLRLHKAKFHAEERVHEEHVEAGPGGQGGAGGGDTRLKFYEDGGGAVSQYHKSPVSSDGLPSQQVPEMELSYMNSSPEDISEFGGKSVSELAGSLGGGGGFSGIPTIHIPEFDNIQSKMGDNGEISNEAIQALLFS